MSVVFYNRYTKKLETEKVPGCRSLRWLYNTELGKITLNALIKRKLFSEFMKIWMRNPISKRTIHSFIKSHGINLEEFEMPAKGYSSFNDFFIRKLKNGSRKIDQAELIFPADGRHVGFQDVSDSTKFYVKGACFDLRKLLQNNEISEEFIGGSMLISRLCPADYHRFHFPADCNILSHNKINGYLYSVSPLAMNKNAQFFWENKRYLTILQTEKFNKIAMLEIGATCVGSVIQTYKNGSTYKKGQEKGYFQFGGSSIILLFQKGCVKLAEDLLEHAKSGNELYARCGDRLLG